MVPPFVEQAARALPEAGQLDRYITNFRYDAAIARALDPAVWKASVGPRFERIASSPGWRAAKRFRFRLGT